MEYSGFNADRLGAPQNGAPFYFYEFIKGRYVYELADKVRHRDSAGMQNASNPRGSSPLRD
ncbi:hypothetical protein SDC9_144135 [bioreactor metagenome]|uniref:Uncharacterized protein n=1 Tax=bioreactor metagenome TaxID=1076179 RepID=A0A645E634_9ZZZZ